MSESKCPRDIAENVSPTKEEPFRFLDLPAEMQNKIYEYAFEGSEIAYKMIWNESGVVCQFDTAATTNHRDALLMSKDCRKTALPAYYRCSSLKLCGHKWTAATMKACLPDLLANHVVEIRLHALQATELDLGSTLKLDFPKLKWVIASPLRNVVYNLDKDKDVWLSENLDFRTSYIKGFNIGETLSGVRVQGEVWVESVDLTDDSWEEQAFDLPPTALDVSRRTPPFPNHS
jgi:hypothetical protein